MRKLITLPLFLIILLVLQPFNAFSYSSGLEEKKDAIEKSEPLSADFRNSPAIDGDITPLDGPTVSPVKLSEAELSLITEINELPGWPYDFLVQGQYLYVIGADGSDGFMNVYDITNISSPLLKYSQLYPGKKLSTMLYEDSYLYTIGDNGLLIFDVSNPVTPTQAAYHEYVMNGTSKKYFKSGYSNIAKVGNLLFTNGGLWSIFVTDISNIQAPVYLDGFSFSFNTARDYEVISSTELLFNDGAGLRILNFSDPYNLTITRTSDPEYMDTPAQTEQMIVTADKQTAYTYSWGISTSAISVIDIPSRQITATINIKEHTDQLYNFALDATNNRLFSGSHISFHEFDISNSPAVSHVSVNQPGEGRVRVWGNYLYSRKSGSSIMIYGLGAASTPAPVISSFTPESGTVGSSVSISGENFTGANSVKFNESEAHFTVVSSTSISATVPAGASTGKISVTTPAGSAQSHTDFIVETSTLPTISSFTPVSGPEGTVVTITGTNFTGATTLLFHETEATEFNVVSATSIIATVPEGATTGKISVITPEGSAQSTADFTLTSALAPTISAFTPGSGPAGTAVSISGTNFSDATNVAFNGTEVASFNIESASSISTTVPEGATKGTISVTNPEGTGYSSIEFVVELTEPVEEIVNIAEIKGFPGWVSDYLVQGQYLYVIGYKNSDGYLYVYDIANISNPYLEFSQLYPGKKMSTMLYEDHHLYAVGDNGLLIFDVNNPVAPVLAAHHDYVMNGTNKKYFRDGYGNIAKAGNLLFTNGDLWSIFVTDISDIQAPVYLDGFNFDFSEVRDYEVISSTELLFNDGAGLRILNFSDPYNLRITRINELDYIDTPAQTEQMIVTADKQTAYTYSWGLNTSMISVIDIPSRQIISSFDVKPHTSQLYNFGLYPAKDKLYSGGIGNFYEFDVSSSAGISYLNSYSPGQGRVRVWGDYLFARSFSTSIVIYSLGQTNIPAPVISSFTPEIGAEGSTVNITGTDFTDATAVMFNGINAASFTVLSSTSISATVPDGATTGKISVTTPAGSAQSNTDFTVETAPAPRISSFSPGHGAAGTSVTISGSNFTDATNVAFNGIEVASFNLASASSIIATVPEGATTGTISITNEAGTGHSATDFIVTTAITSSGTYLLQDIIPGTTGANPSNFVKAGHRVYFSADEQVSENSVRSGGFYSTDGTDAGTELIKSSFNPDIYDPFLEKNAVDFKGKLVLTAYSDVHELWVSDGTSAGTTLVLSFPAESSYRFNALTVFNNALYFTIEGASDMRGAYQWDGTNAPVRLVAASELNHGENIELIAGDNQLFCSDSHVIYAITNGNAEVIYNQATVNDSRKIGRAAYLNGMILFTETSPTAAIDKVNYGIRALDPVSQQYFSITEQSGQGFPAATKFSPGMAYMGGSLYYSSTVHTSANSAYQLWKISDSFGLSLVKEWSSETNVKAGIFAANSHLLIFSFELDNSDNSQLWKSDGSTAGTLAIIEESDQINIKDEQTSIYLTDSRLFFGARKKTAEEPFTEFGTELWISDFSKNGTLMAFDLNEGAYPGFLSTHIASLDGNSVIFAGKGATAAAGSPYGGEVWVSDGYQLCHMAQPTVSISQSSATGVTLSSSHNSGNQWLKDGEPIAGATSQTYMALESGNYAVKVSEGSCSSTSEEVTVTITGLRELSEIGISVYPNPNQGTLLVNLGKTGHEWKARLMNVAGKLMKEAEVSNGENLQLDLSQYPAGLYMLVLSNGKDTYNSKIIKQ